MQVEMRLSLCIHRLMAQWFNNWWLLSCGYTLKGWVERVSFRHKNDFICFNQRLIWEREKRFSHLHLNNLQWCTRHLCTLVYKFCEWCSLCEMWMRNLMESFLECFVLHMIHIKVFLNCSKIQQNFKNNQKLNLNFCRKCFLVFTLKRDNST